MQCHEGQDRDVAWWKRAVVYQIYPRSFADSDGDGIGDLRGIIDRLDHLAALGVDVVWLSPIYPSPQYDNGYDVSDYCDIDPVYGELATFDELLAEVHDRGMALVMDLVFNHTSHQHPWFLASRSGPNNPKRDWYWWRPPRAGMEPGAPGAEPTNWRAAFGGPAWTLDPTSGEYYLHLFSPEQPDLNWENPEVRRALHGVMRWWLDRGVDGFRLDVINHVSKDPRLPDGQPLPGGHLGDGSPHFVSGPRIHEFLQEMRREVIAPRENPPLMIGEMPGATVDEAVRFTNPARGELDMVFTFEHLQLDHGVDKWDTKPLDLRELKASLGRWQAGLADAGWNSLYLNNHDQPRSVSRFGDDGVHRVRSAKLLATLLHLHRGTPFIYQGEELGMTNASLTSIDELRDVESLNRFAEQVAHGVAEDDALARIRPMSRDNSRTPMPWDDGEHAGFTHGIPWIPLDPDHEQMNAKAAYGDKDSVFHHYRRLIELRHTDPVVVHGDFTMLLPNDERVYAFTRRLDEAELLVVANVSGDDVEVQLPDAARWQHAELVLDNINGTGLGDQHVVPPAQPADVVRLQPWEAQVWRSTIARVKP